MVVGTFSYINLNNNAESQVIYSLGLFTEMANSRLLDYWTVLKRGPGDCCHPGYLSKHESFEEAGWDLNDPAWKKNATILDDFLSSG